jgi:hypothetical protein
MEYEIEMEDDIKEMASESPGMSDDEFQAAVKAQIQDAADYIDDRIARDREDAMSYYRGDPLGSEEEGRSQIVMTEVRDVVQAMMPSLLRVFTSSEKAVEFAPRREEDVPAAEQATDYINYIFHNDNNGFKILYDAIKDALVSKVGVIKWRVDEKTEVEEIAYSGLDEEQAALILSDPDVELLEQEMEFSEVGDGMIEMASPPLISLKVRRTTRDSKFCVEAIPPEEFIISKNARDLDTADYVGHRKLMTVSDLVAMGYDREVIEQHAGNVQTFDINTEAFTRNNGLDDMLGIHNSDETMERVLYVESFVRVDKDGDGIAELRRVCSVGGAAEILHDEVIDDVPMAVLCPDPTPHLVIGQSIADQVMDLQRIKTAIMRNTLDSLAQVIHPRTVVVEGSVNMDDVLNTETGGIIRARAPGMVQPLAEPFVGQSALPLIAYLDDVRSSRTGISKASQGLDPDVLQSTTKAAVTATMAAAEQRLEMIARVFAETGIRRLFRGLLKLVVRHQDRARMVRLRNQWVPIDPRDWDSEMDVVVNVGLGNGNVAERTALLTQVLTKQEQMLQMLGPNNPMVDLAQYRNTMAKILELNGIKDVSKHFKPITPEVMQRLEQAQAAAKPKQNPAEMLAQVEAQKIQADIAIAQSKAQLEAQKAVMDDDRARDKDEADMLLKVAELELKYGQPVNSAAIIERMERNRSNPSVQ